MAGSRGGHRVRKTASHIMILLNTGKSELRKEPHTREQGVDLPSLPSQLLPVAWGSSPCFSYTSLRGASSEGSHAAFPARVQTWCPSPSSSGTAAVLRGSGTRPCPPLLAYLPSSWNRPWTMTGCGRGWAAQSCPILAALEPGSGVLKPSVPSSGYQDRECQ
jgi:hypothetical protein